MTEKIDRKQWLEQLKEGDSVAIKTGSYGRRYYVIRKITRITPTRRITLDDGSKFNNNGIEMGNKGRWNPSETIEPITQEILDSIQREKLLYQISNTKFQSFSLDSLKKIAEIIRIEEK